jgi:Ca2+-binding EF-hand superfamily protein
MTKTPPVLASALVLVFCSTVAYAQSSASLPPPPSNASEVEARFKSADKNGDGKVTREEAQTTMPRVAMAWEKIDVDKKGYITLEQLLIISARNQ